MKRREEISREDFVGVGEKNERTDEKKDTADYNIAPQDAEVLPERKLLNGLLLAGHLGMFGRFFASLLVSLLWRRGAVSESALQFLERGADAAGEVG